MNPNNISAIREETYRLRDSIASIEGRCSLERRTPTDAETREILRCHRRCGELGEDYEKIQSTGFFKPFEGDDRNRPDLGGYQPAASTRGLVPNEFPSAGAFWGAVVRAGTPGQAVDPKLTSMQRAEGLGELVPSEGGFLVGTDTTADILTRSYESGQLAKLCRLIPIGAGKNSVKINAIDETDRATGSRFGGARSYWLNEAGEKTASKPKFRQIELKPKKLIGLVYLTDELIQDATAMESIVKDIFSEEIAFMLDDAILNGSGAGQPLGILSSPSLVTVSEETSQSITTVNPHNLSKMWARMWGKSKRNAVWICNSDVTAQLMTLQLQDSYAGSPLFGAPVFLPAGAVAGAPYGTIFGRPIIEAEQCPTLGLKGDIVLADFREYLLAKIGGLQVDISIHVRFIYDEQAIRFVLRVDGCPSWNAALTPFSGSSTQSPFICLEDRT